MNLAKDEAKKLIEKLPDTATWDDIMYELYVKKKIAAGLIKAASCSMKLEWTEPAVLDLENISEYIAKGCYSNIQ